MIIRMVEKTLKVKCKLSVYTVRYHHQHQPPTRLKKIKNERLTLTQIRGRGQNAELNHTTPPKMRRNMLLLAVFCCLFAISPAQGAQNSTDSKVDADEDKALLVGLKNSGSGVAGATYAILGIALATNVDASTLLWHGSLLL